MPSTSASSPTSSVRRANAAHITIDAVMGEPSDAAMSVTGTSTTSSDERSIGPSNNDEYSITTAPVCSLGTIGCQYLWCMTIADHAWETIGGDSSGPSPMTT